MKTLIVRTLFFVGLLVILTPILLAQEDGARLHALAKNDTSPTFSLTLSPGKPKEIISEYRVGDDMWMTIIMTNLTNHDIDCTMDGGGGYDRMFGYEAIDEDGKRVGERHHGTEGYHHGCTLPSGANNPRMILLNQVFKLDRPGKYTIRVSRPEPFVEDEKGESPVIWSNSITIQITS